jgi:DNA-binding response OmpR family regulator
MVCGRVPVMRILVVEDEIKTAAFIRKALKGEGFHVDLIDQGDHVLPYLANHPADVIVLDIMLPKRDGLSVLRELRRRNDATPVLLLSARGGMEDRVEGLDAGADDYLPKPFGLSELIARVRALGRRNLPLQESETRLSDLVLDSIARTARRGNAFIELSTREFLLLDFLMRSAGRICDRATILQQVWGYSFDPGTNIVDVYVRRIREKVDTGFAVRLLHTVRGMGYVMRVEP